MRLPRYIFLILLCLLLMSACVKRIEPGPSTMELEDQIPPPPPPLTEPRESPIFFRWEEAPKNLIAALYEQNLIRQAEKIGLWPSRKYPLHTAMNPYYLRGDFNGDGENDVAFWISEETTGKTGLAIIHSTLDSLYLFGAGSASPEGEDMLGVGDWRTWYVRRKGTVDTPYNSIPEIEVEMGEPFRFERESVQIISINQSGFALYWARGAYHAIWTMD